MTGDVAEGGYELVEFGVHTRTAHQLDACLLLAAIGHALADFVVGLGDELWGE